MMEIMIQSKDGTYAYMPITVTEVRFGYRMPPDGDKPIRMLDKERQKMATLYITPGELEALVKGLESEYYGTIEVEQ